MFASHWWRPTPTQCFPFTGWAMHSFNACPSLATHYIHAMLVSGIILLILPTAGYSCPTSAGFIASQGDILHYLLPTIDWPCSSDCLLVDLYIWRGKHSSYMNVHMRIWIPWEWLFVLYPSDNKSKNDLSHLYWNEIPT